MEKPITGDNAIRALEKGKESNPNHHYGFGKDTEKNLCAIDVDLSPRQIVR
jgi:hypothetical protein